MKNDTTLVDAILNNDKTKLKSQIAQVALLKLKEAKDKLKK